MDSTKGGFAPEADSAGFFEIGTGPPEFIEASSRYCLGDLLGQGGMGVVYRARDLDLNRDVAIKILTGELGGSNNASYQFVNEARIMGMLQHPGIAHIYDYGTTDSGRPFHAMKLVEGKDLAELLDEREGTPHLNAQLLNVFSVVCQTIAYTHSQEVIHLDLKPANIMVGAYGEVHVMDWGLAKSVNSVQMQPTVVECLNLNGSPAETSNNRIYGTLRYMAPEQARAGTVDKRTDVFCLGAILCEVLTGYPPYDGEVRAEVLVKARNAELQPAIDRLNQCDDEKFLVRLAKRCLRAVPADRPCDATVLAKEMASYSESALQRIQNELTQFFELSLDLFCIAGFDGFFRRINQNFSRVLGYSDQELLSRPFLDFVYPDDRDKTIDIMSNLLNGQPVVRFRNRYLTKQGKVIEFEWTSKSIIKENLIFAVARYLDEPGDPDSNPGR